MAAGATGSVTGCQDAFRQKRAKTAFGIERKSEQGRAKRLLRVWEGTVVFLLNADNYRRSWCRDSPELPWCWCGREIPPPPPLLLPN